MHPRDDLSQLILDIKSIMGPNCGLDDAHIDVNTLIERLSQYDATSVSAGWQRFAFNDTDVSYTRNGVDDINDKANLLILVWNPGRPSAIHDHANAHCIVKVLHGELSETLYHLKPGSAPQAYRVSNYTTNDVSYMSDNLGVHKMENTGIEPAISLHLYTPPYAMKYGCNSYDKDSGSLSHSYMSLYSNGGNVLHKG